MTFLSVFDAAAETGRRVVLTGFDVENIVRTGIRLNKLSLANEKLLIKPKEMSRFEDHELIIQLQQLHPDYPLMP